MSTAAGLPRAERTLPGGRGAAARVLRLGAGRAAIEIKTTLRNPQAAFFLVLLPVLLLVIFAAVFDHEIEETGISFRRYFLAGIVASAIFGTTFSNLATGISIESHERLLKRLGGTPLPKTSYFLGKIGAALAITIVQVAVMLVIAGMVYGIDLPSQGAQWLRLVWVLLLGVAAGCSVGIAYTRLIPNARAAPAIVQPPFLVLQFISGVFFVFTELPEWMRAVATVFPLKWLAQGLRAVFLPSEFAAQEPAGSWQLGLIALILAIWFLAGLIIAVRTFRWTRAGT